MDRDTAIKMAQQAIKAKNKRLVDAVLQIRAERDKLPAADVPVAELPLIAVTCATGSKRCSRRPRPAIQVC